jgi:hypothetical protein
MVPRTSGRGKEVSKKQESPGAVDEVRCMIRNFEDQHDGKIL